MKRRHFRMLRAGATAWLLVGALVLNACAGKSNSGGGSALSGVGNDIRPDYADSHSAGVRTSDLLKAKVGQIGTDGGALFGFVAKSLGYEAYAGALRGSRGVLLAGGGNAVDKSLLMVDLFRAADPNAQVRFAFCTLSDDQAGQLGSKAMAAAAAPPVPATQPSPVASPGDIDPAVQKQAQQLIDAWRVVSDSAKSEAANLASLATKAGASTPSPFLSSAQLSQWSRDHVWVQRQEGGRWVDYDTTLDAGGSTRCAAERTASALPEALYHHVLIRIRAEERQGGTVTSRTLISGSWRAANLVGSSVTMLFAEPFNLGAWVGDASPAPAGGKHYTPIMIVDDNLVKGTPLTLPAPPQPASSGGTASALDVMGNKLQGNPTPAPTVPQNTQAQGPEITGVWLDVTVALPKGSARTVERTIFDRIGYAARLHASAQDAPLAPLDAKYGEYAALAKQWNLAVWLGEPASAPDTPADPDHSDVLQAFSILGTYHHSYYGLRQTILAQAFGPQLPRFLATGPSVSLLTEQFGAADDASDAVLTVDRLYESVGALPGSRAVAASSPVGALWGTSALEAERFLFLAPLIAFGSADPTASAAAMVDVKSVFEAAQSGNVRVSRLEPSDSRSIGSLQGTDEAKARIAASLQDGNPVLVPEHPVHVGNADVLGWWNVDPTNGFFFDEFETGEHGTAETGIQTSQAVQQVSTVRRFAMALFRAYCASYKYLTVIAFLIIAVNRARPDVLPNNWIVDTAIYTAGAITALTRLVKCPNGPYEPPPLPKPPVDLPPFPLPVV